MGFQPSRVLEGHAVRFLLPRPGRNLDEAGIAGNPQLRAELRPGEVTLDVPRRL